MVKQKKWKTTKINKRSVNNCYYSDPVWMSLDEIIEQNTTNKSSSNEVTTSSKKSGVNVSNSDISGDDLEGFFAFNVVIYFIFVIINWRYVKRHNNGDTILGKIKNNRGLVMMYYIFGIFTYLDIIIIVFATIYKNRLKKIF